MAAGSARGMTSPQSPGKGLAPSQKERERLLASALPSSSNLSSGRDHQGYAPPDRGQSGSNSSDGLNAPAGDMAQVLQMVRGAVQRPPSRPSSNAGWGSRSTTPSWQSSGKEQTQRIAASCPNSHRDRKHKSSGSEAKSASDGKVIAAEDIQTGGSRDSAERTRTGTGPNGVSTSGSRSLSMKTLEEDFEETRRQLSKAQRQQHELLDALVMALEDAGESTARSRGPDTERSRLLDTERSRITEAKEPGRLPSPHDHDRNHSDRSDLERRGPARHDPHRPGRRGDGFDLKSCLGF